MTCAALVLVLQMLAPSPPPTAMLQPTPTTTPRPVPAAPRAIVERLVTTPDQFTRLSLFDDRIAVVSMRHDDQVVVRRRLLDTEEYAVYRAAMILEAGALTDDAVKQPIGDTAPVRAELRLDLDPETAARRLVYSPLRLQGIPLERLQDMLDDLEAQVIATPQTQVELARWQPRLGDRVELVVRRQATVIQVEEDGLVVLEHDGTHVREWVPVAGRTTAIQSLLGRSP